MLIPSKNSWVLQSDWNVQSVRDEFLRREREKPEDAIRNPQSWSVSPNFSEGRVAFSHPRLRDEGSVMTSGVQAALTRSACAYPMPAGVGARSTPCKMGIGDQKKKKRKEQKKKKQKKKKEKETHTPKRFLDNFCTAAFGDGGTRKLTCEGIVGRSDTLPNRSRRAGPSGRQPRRPRSPRGRDASWDCPGASSS